MENVTLFFVTLFLKYPKTELHPTMQKYTNNFGCCKDKAEIKEKNVDCYQSPSNQTPSKVSEFYTTCFHNC